MEASPAATALAELVVLNSRKQGSRRALKNPVTIIGSTPGCDVRLDVASVRPIHCLIVLGADGLHLRSWGADDTLVNGAPVLTRVFCDDDVLRVGPFEFRVRWTPTPTTVRPEPAEANPGPNWETLAAASSIPVEAGDKPHRLEELHRQLGEARADFRRERSRHDADHARQLHDLAEAREQLARREEYTAGQRARLNRLRASFLKRWKKHWSTQRVGVEAERARLTEERSRFAAERRQFKQEHERLGAREQVEKRRLEYGWEQLRAAERHARGEQARREAALDQRQQAVADGEGRLKAAQAMLHVERMQLEHHSADLRVEADGMESRVVNLRAVLLQLDEQRARTGMPGVAAAPRTAAPMYAEPMPAEGHNQHLLFERLADELAVQRGSLLEQIDRLAIARESWRTEESRLVGEMAELAEQLRRREEQLAENEIALAFEREQLDRQAGSQRQLQEQLEVRQARQESIETHWRSELGRREIELQQRGRDCERRDRAWPELCRRLSERRRREIAQLREEHRRCAKLCLDWAEQTAAGARREQAIEERERDLAVSALALEKARQQLVESGGRSELARKKLERLDRRLRATIARSEARLERRRLALAAERTELAGLCQRAAERIEEDALKQRESADRLTELERREHLVERQTLALNEAKTLWTNQREMFERERNDLRDEVERLAALIMEKDEQPPVPLTRAA